MIDNVLNSAKIYIFAKDKNLKFLYCNEIFAEAAGLDSPAQIKKKTDSDLCWREQADLYNSGDRWVLKGGIFVNVPEPLIQLSRIYNVLTTKTLFKDKKNKLIGLTGSFIDITGSTIMKNNSSYDSKEKKLYLKDLPNSQYLTKNEILILKYLLLGCSSEKIIKHTNKSEKTINLYVAKIQSKLQCDLKCEIVPRAVELGLTYILNSF